MYVKFPWRYGIRLFLGIALFFLALPPAPTSTGNVTQKVLANGISYPLSSGHPAIVNALNYLRSKQESSGKITGSAISAWAVMGIVAAGQPPHAWKAGSFSIVDYLKTTITYLKTNPSTPATDWARSIMAAVAAGENPWAFGGENLITKLKSFYDGSQIGPASTLNDDFWGIIALISAGESPGSPVITGAKTYILSHQNADGGWCWVVGQGSDCDSTSAAILALIAAGVSPSSQSIQAALNYLKTQQDSQGGFGLWGKSNSASDSWALCALQAAEEDPLDVEWTKNGHNVIEHLLALQDTDGAFRWTPTAKTNPEWMTSYAIVALLGKPYPVVTTSDSIPPAISSGTPASGSIIIEEKPFVSAEYSDNLSGIDISSVMVLVDGTNVTPECNITATGLSYLPFNALGQGEHAINVTIADLAGNQQSLQWSFTIALSIPTPTPSPSPTPSPTPTPTPTPTFTPSPTPSPTPAATPTPTTTPSPTPGPGDTVKDVTIGYTSINVGETGMTNVYINGYSGSNGLGAYDVKVIFDQSKVNVINVSGGNAPFDAIPTNNLPICNTTGQLALNAFHAAVPGPTDLIIKLTTITWQGMATGTHILTLHITSLTSVNGNDVTGAVPVNGFVTVSSTITATPTPTPIPTPAPISTPSLAKAPTPTPTPEPTQPPPTPMPIPKTTSGKVIAMDSKGRMVEAWNELPHFEQRAGKNVVVVLPVNLTEGAVLSSFNNAESGTEFSNNRLVLPVLDKQGSEVMKVIVNTADAIGTGSSAEAVVNSLVLKTVESRVDFTPEYPPVGTVAAQLEAKLKIFPDDASITVELTRKGIARIKAEFKQLTAAQGYDIADVAYAMEVKKTKLENVTHVMEATVTMKVARAWVVEHGPSNIRVLRLSEDGEREILDTTLAGIDEKGLAIFKAHSPNGLSIFSLVAFAPIHFVTPGSPPVPVPELTQTPDENEPEGKGIKLWLILGIVAIIVAGVSGVLWRRRMSRYDEP